ncbi:hypothetical protein PF010_g17263 [Phytophthora fragariae]|uniref:Uncharacterized protein n=2 Tax=Phytophthora TaxID=4783 RepID=A0A6A3ELD1_9STRA|nr:hypothetical protein PF003_g25994 [Phytophthora fragariae]KAE8962462.1 hypothetical protein PR001_g29699 [Phytophthora rubi]KAE8934305.1 hypothetical protein PF009_g15723 [Phytophthora fragariae]KAE9001045.1 hypothetical protein PF011_g13922 [Phytophthora fragariae]KAE9094029.1 hypothetical protein PF010_g17263 [Phytophthora fragariae]
MRPSQDAAPRSPALLTALPLTTGWMAPIVAKGDKLFDSEAGLEFRMKGTHSRLGDAKCKDNCSLRVRFP